VRGSGEVIEFPFIFLTPSRIWFISGLELLPEVRIDNLPAIALGRGRLDPFVFRGFHALLETLDGPPRSSPMLRSFLVPKTSMTMTNTISQCQILKPPMNCLPRP